MMLALWLAVQKPAFDFEVESGKGLVVRLQGVPVIRGSWFQFYRPGWSKGYYSSQNESQQVRRVDDNTVNVSFGSPGSARGMVAYHRDGNSLTVHYEFNWDGDDASQIEVTSAALWAPALEEGSLTADGKPTRALNSFSYDGSELGARRFSPDSASYGFAAPLGKITERSSVPLTLFDARGGYRQDWAEGHEYWWLGDLSLPVAKGKPAALDVQWTFEPGAAPENAPVKAALAARRTDQALLPDESKPVLVPHPQTNQLDWEHPLELTNSFTFPAGVFDDYDVFEAALARRFVVPAATASTKKIAFDAGVSKLGLTPGGYRILVTSKSITVLGEEAEGLRNGLERLASLAFAADGKLWLPTGLLLDQPQTEWRGVHLFVGPHAREFQTKLWTRVLRPLGFDKVVLECERTAWDALPGIGTAQTMPKAELVKLFEMYRGLGVEPIPLVQSYGHMEWLFENGKNLDIAYNPNVPYAVDPLKPRTQEMLTSLWNEVIDALKPRTIHFGLDEVDMEGFQENPPVETELWQKQLLFLDKLAEDHSVQMMLWGDQCLARGEAPDATNGDTARDAALRRAAIRRGSFIGDWHYIDDRRAQTYVKTLQLWKDAGMRPIASTSSKPGNIAGFDVAAGHLGVGTLQTTWAGFESSEERMLDAMPQFTAMILAADYSWSARTDAPDKLPYDPAEIFRRMYFGRPSPLTPRPGFDVGPAGASIEIGSVRYGAPLDLRLASVLAAKAGGGSSIALTVDGKGRELALAVTCQVAAEDGEPVADVAVTLSDGKTVSKRLVYGRHVRAQTDRGPMAISDRNKDGICSFRIDLGAPVGVKRVELKPLNTYTGLSVWGLELID